MEPPNFHSALPDLCSRNDVSIVVRTFYRKVRKDDLLGPIFNKIVTDWEEHLEKLTDFWTMNLWGSTAANYDGNPIEAHQHADSESGHSIAPIHFGQWLNLWFETINDLYNGQNAEILKRRARKMQTPIMVSIYNGRTKT